jgi:hypothetical protein
MKLFFSLKILLVIISRISTQENETFNSTIYETNNTDINNTEVFKLPDEILKDYAEYKVLEELSAEQTCSMEHNFQMYDENKIVEKIKKDPCIVNSKTFSLILEAGWLNAARHLVQEIYLVKYIDPSHTLYTYINKYESNSSKLKNLLYENISGELKTNYSFENSENSVRVIVKLPDSSFNVEYLSVYCYKDLMKINGIFKTRNKLFKIVDSKYFFDLIEGDCQHNFNSYNGEIEIDFQKKNKLKVWNSLFK